MLTKAQKIEEVLTRGVVQVLPSKKGLANLMMKKKIRLYNGIDPTSPKIHIGNAVPLLKLKQFQELGHEVILLVGTFTAQIGDPAGHEEARKPLTSSEIKTNITTYKKQASKILDFSKVKMVYNADWLSKMKMADFIKLASNFSVQRIIERDLFQRRIKKKKPIWLNEFVYPLFQGHDSVHLNVDLEIGATEQMFNMLIGRELQKIYNKKEKFVLMLPMIPGLDGRKMSKTYGNTVNLEDSPNEMFGKIMSLRDDLMPLYFEACTELPMKDIKRTNKDLKLKKVNPRDLKIKLAKEIVALYHSRQKAEKAAREFEKIFKQKKLPTRIPEIKVDKKEMDITTLLVKVKLASSKSEAKRLILQGGVKINGKIQKEWRKRIEATKNMIIQAGKRRFVKIKK